MKSQTNSLKLQSTEELERQFNNVQDILCYESFGRDDEARYELMDERSKLFKELKRRNWGPFGSPKV